MDLGAQSLWRVEFARKAAVSRELEDRLRTEKHIEDRKRQRDEAADLRDDADLMAVFEVLATDARIAEFGVKLDTYDTVTVEALMANGVDLQAARDRIENIILEAHTLPDGRRVYKSRDGCRVVDETGAELSPETVDPQAIDDRKPRWEDLLDAREEETRLLEERRELIDYQQKLDAAREKLEDPSLTTKELDALESELGETAPARVKASLGVLSEPPPDLARPPEALKLPDVQALSEREARNTTATGPGFGPA